MKNKYIIEILKEYDRLQENAKLEQKKRREEIYYKFPRIKAIDEEISKIGLNLASSILKGGDCDELISQSKKGLPILKWKKLNSLYKITILWITLKLNINAINVKIQDMLEVKDVHALSKRL